MSPLPLPPSELLDEAPKPPTPPPNRKDPRVPLHNESRTPAHAHVRLGGVSVGVSSSESYHGLGVDDDVEEDSGEYLAPVLLADQEKLASRPGNAYATVLNTEVGVRPLQSRECVLRGGNTCVCSMAIRYVVRMFPLLTPNNSG